jgi:peroxiredoxin
VEFLGVNLQDEPEAAQRIVEETGVTYELALDRDGQAFAAFGGVGMPTTIFIDEQGRIVEHHTGILTSEQLDAQIDRLLEA